MSELVSRVGRVTQPMKTDFFTRQVPKPKKNQVVIKIKASAICGSDIHIFKGKHPAVQLPATIGHEFSGEVAAVGEGVSIALGSRVTVEPCIVCGTCEACRHGNYGYCESISFTYRKGDGAMADYITAEAPYVYELPEHLSFEAGALIEPLSVAVHAVRRADIRLGETVCVIGAGAIGILIAAVCKRSGASKIIVSDYSPHRLEAALELGATHTVNLSSQRFDDALNSITNGKGVHKSFECVGLESSFVQSMTCLKRDGTATIVGIFEQPGIQIPASLFVSREIKVQGSQGYCWDFPVALELSREINLNRMITHTFPLEELQTALETCLDRDSGSIKALLKP